MRRPSRLLGATARLVVATGLLLAGAVVAATSAHAEDINALTVDATVNADTSLHIVETIDYDFEGSYRHGIFRDLPVYDETLTGQRRSYALEVESVSMDGAVIPWESSDEGPFRRLTIGDPNQTITGPHTYVITYTVRDALRDYLNPAALLANPLLRSRLILGLGAGDAASPARAMTFSRASVPDAIATHTQVSRITPTDHAGFR